MTDPRGIRSNNPLNIDYHPTQKWQGLADPPTDGRFARFVKPEFGVRAGVIILQAYRKRGVVTVRQIISRWAPPVENSTENYIAFVCRKSGLTPETEIDLANRDQVLSLLKAMVLMECGPAPAGTANGNWLDDAVFEAGYSLANPLWKSRTVRGSAMAVGSAVAGAVVQIAQDVLPQAVEAATTVTPIWPEIARWVLIAVCIAGGALAFYARRQAKQEGIR